MGQQFKCAFGMHEYEVYKEFPFTETIIKKDADPFIFQTGHVIISRCKHCGKIKFIEIPTNYIR